MGRRPVRLSERRITMRKTGWTAALPALLALLLMLTAGTALADPGWSFTEKQVVLYEGETFQTEILREGAAAEEGKITYVSSSPAAVSVSEDGTVTALKKGKASVTARLAIGKKRWKTVLDVTVLRRVTRVTLNTKGLPVYDPSDLQIEGLLKEPADGPVLVIPAGRSVQLKAVCTPEDASSTKVVYSTDDAGVARVSGAVLQAQQRGECNLTIASVQNPEVTETIRVAVIQPVRKLELSAGNRKVAVGGMLQADFSCEPSNASLQSVIWSSRNPTIASVDENGVITGLKKGNAVIAAKAADGSGATATITVSVTRTAEAITLNHAEIEAVANGKPVYLKAVLSPADTSDKSVHWESSDPEIATVEAGKVIGRRAGTCTVTATSLSNPALTASAQVRVVQRVTAIVFDDPQGISMKVGETAQLSWRVEPEDASDKSVTFSTNHTAIATVDGSGLVRGLKRGVATITAKAADKSNKTGRIKVTVIQPVLGVQLKVFLHHVQLYDEYHRATALTVPRDANNQNMIWTTGDPYIATARGTGNACYLTGNQVGDTSLTVTTEDGGYTATGEIRVRDYNGAVLVEGLWVDADNRIRIVLRNMSDFTIARVHFRVECFDREGNPMVCNVDGESTSFEGTYPLALDPGMRSVHGQFTFRDAAFTDPLGMVVLTVTRYTDLEGYTWDIPEEAQVPRNWDWRLDPRESPNG